MCIHVLDGDALGLIRAEHLDEKRAGKSAQGHAVFLVCVEYIKQAVLEQEGEGLVRGC